MFTAVGDHLLHLKLIKFGKYFQMGEHLEIIEQLKRRLQKVELYNANFLISKTPLRYHILVNLVLLSLYNYYICKYLELCVYGN
jgi:hypothetical protein